MIHVRPFRAWRPPPHLAHLVGSRSFVQYAPEELQQKLDSNPYTYLHVVHAAHESTDMSRSEHFDQVRNEFHAFTNKGILIREEMPAFYLYEQSCARFISRGLIGAVDVQDYKQGRIKVHEQTLTAREELFTDYLHHTGINAEPVLLAVPGAEALEEDLLRLMQLAPLFDFTTTDEIRHRFWRITKPEEIQRLQQRFRSTQAMYIADGHHRCASSVRLADRAGARPGDPKSAFLAFMVPEQELHIFNFDRTVKGLNGLSPAELLDRLEQVGPLNSLKAPDEEPQEGHVQVYLEGNWYRLALPQPNEKGPLAQLDAYRLGTAVLGPVLGVTDLRVDPRVGFVPGIDGLKELTRTVNSGEADVAFHLRSATFSQLQTVADAGLSMPPKTTWIEPKLRSGLTVYSLEDN